MKIPLVALLAALFCLPEPAGAQVLFDFHSAFWMNLHHYLQALGRAAEPLVEDLPAGASDAERAEWARAVDFYRTRFGKRRLVFDEMLVGIKRELIAAGSAPALTDLQLREEHRRVLERAAPIYRRHRWPDHQARNKAFITDMQRLLARHGRAIAARLAASYDTTWPAGGFRVDIVRDAGPPGNAYTTNVPPPSHITVGVQETGLTALELIFHEASHAWDQQLMRVVDDAAKATGRRAPPDLWHALLFFNAGAITRDVLAAAGIKDYELMMTSGQIFARPGWHEAIARHWPAFLAGKVSRDEVAQRVLKELP